MKLIDKRQKKVLSYLLTFIFLFSIVYTLTIPLFGVEIAKAVGVETEKAYFPMQYLKITQGVNGQFSHQGTYQMDCMGKDLGIDNVFAPFTGTIKRIEVSSNAIWLESNNTVEYADGTIDYLTVRFVHDNDVSDLWVGKVIPQGTVFYQEGTAGYTTGNHLQLECGKGKFTGAGYYENSYGNWMIDNSLNPYDALFLQSSTIVLNGYGYNWRTASVQYATVEVVQQAYRDILEREANQSELDTYVGNYTVDFIRNDLIASDEYKQLQARKSESSPITPNVTRIYGQDRFQTSIAVAEQEFKDQEMNNVILATGYNFPDALSASTLAIKLRAPIILVGQSVLDSQVSLDYIKSRLVVGGTVTIVGGSAVVPTQIEQWLLNSGYKVVRLAGEDRYDTNALIVNKLNVVTGTPVVIASGNDFPDALGIASFAASKGWPILLSGPNQLPDSVKAFLATNQPSDAYIVGGETILSNAVLGELNKASPTTKMTRFGGYDRFDTLSQVVTNFYPNPTEIYLASGLDFADALSGSVIAAQRNAPIILIDPQANALPPAIREYLVKHLNLKVNVLGGTAAVPEWAVALVKGYVGGN